MQSKNIWHYVRVAEIENVAESIRSFVLKPETGKPILYTAGSHLDLEVLIEGKIQIRSYSLIGLPNGRTYKIAVKHLQPSRGGSDYMFKLKKDSRVKVSYPINNFEMYRHPSGQPSDQVVLVAGGIGITPLYTISQALSKSNVSCQLHYAARSDKQFGFIDDVSEFLGKNLYLYSGEKNKRIDLDRLLGGLPEKSVLYFCGPKPMLEQAQKIWKNQNRPLENFRFETFGSSGQYATEPFDVKIPRLEKTVRVAENTSMLDALISAGVEVIYDCKKGECGLCALDILDVDGNIDHRDVFFSENEKTQNDRMCACVSRISGKSVTIDTDDRPDDSSLNDHP